jgi:hypothetical protein
LAGLKIIQSRRQCLAAATAATACLAAARGCPAGCPFGSSFAAAVAVEAAASGAAVASAGLAVFAAAVGKHFKSMSLDSFSRNMSEPWKSKVCQGIPWSSLVEGGGDCTTGLARNRFRIDLFIVKQQYFDYYMLSLHNLFQGILNEGE